MYAIDALYTFVEFKSSSRLCSSSALFNTMAAARNKSQLDEIMASISRTTCKNSRNAVKTRHATQLQNWWRGICRQDMRKLCEELLVPCMHRGAGHSFSIPPSWIFLKNQNIPAATLYFLTWENGWTHRSGPWFFYSSYHTFRTTTESQYLIAKRVWRSVPPSKAPKQYGRKGEILYDPVLRHFILQEREFLGGTQRARIFETIWGVLLHVRYTNDLERMRVRSYSASLIQWYWRKVHGYQYVQPKVFGEQSDSEHSCSDSDI